MTQIEKYAHEGIRLLQIQDGDGPYHQFYLAWNEYRHNPAILQKVTDYYLVGSALSMFLSYGTVSDIDTRQSIASVSYMFLSMAIEQDSHNPNYYKARLILMHDQQEALQYTVSSVVNAGSSLFHHLSFGGMAARDALLKMKYYDVATQPLLTTVPLFANIKNELEQKIRNNFFAGQDSRDIVVSGKQHHKEVLAYIKRKVLEEEDLVF